MKGVYWLKDQEVELIKQVSELWMKEYEFLENHEDAIIDNTSIGIYNLFYRDFVYIIDKNA